MYIDRFIAGILFTIGIEAILIVLYGIYISTKGKGE